MREKNMFGKGMMFNTEVTNGTCPLCQTDTIFVSLHSHIYRCMNCGVDTEQKVNGVISFMPLTPPGAKRPVMTVIQENGSDKS
jgi:predicted metal-binding protein